MGIVRSPHDPLDPDLVTYRGLGRPQEAGADIKVPFEVLAGREAHSLRRGTKEIRLGRIAKGHTSVEPVERLEPARDPGQTLLGENELQVWMAFEHPTEDQMPDRSVGEPGDLHEHYRSGHFVISVVRDPTASVDVDCDP